MNYCEYCGAKIIEEEPMVVGDRYGKRTFCSEMCAQRWKTEGLA